MTTPIKVTAILGTYRKSGVIDSAVDEILAAATSGVREARNGGEFLAAVAERTGIRPRVITGMPPLLLS